MTYGIPPPSVVAPVTPSRTAPVGAGARKARKAGDRAEDLVLRGAKQDGRAWVVKRPIPFRPLGGAPKGGQFMAVRSASAGVDFTGCLQGGLHLAVEVKSGQAASLPLRNQAGDQVGPSQVAELNAVARLGGIGGVLVRLHPGVRAQGGGLPPVCWWWVPWTNFQCAAAECEARGRASLGVRDLEAWGYRCEAWPDGAPRWVDAVMASEESTEPARTT